MIAANKYMNMTFNGYTVLGYYIKESADYIELKVKCCKCNACRTVRVKYENITKIKCKTCHRLAIIVPINYYNNTKIAKEIVVIGEYKYRKLKRQYKEIVEETGLKELEFIRNNLNRGNGNG